MFPGTRRPIVGGLLLLGCIYGIVGAALNVNGRPYRPDWKGALHIIAGRAQSGDRVIVDGDLDKVCARYYLRREGREAIEVMTQKEYDNLPNPGPAWTIAWSSDSTSTASTSGHLAVERLGAEPRPERLEYLIRNVGWPPRVYLGACPVELLGTGWTQSETWNSDETVRWAARRGVAVYLPLREGQSGRLTIRVFPFSFENAPYQTIQLTIGDRVFSKKDLPFNQFSELSWDIPEGVVKAGYNRITLEFRYLWSPSWNAKNYADFRMLAAAVHWIQWTPSSSPPFSPSSSPPSSSSTSTSPSSPSMGAN